MTIDRRTLGLVLAAWCILYGAAALGTGPDERFETDACGIPPADVPLVAPWKTITVDAEYGGQWVVVGDVDGDGEVEIVSARNCNEVDDHYTSSVVVQKLDGSILWRWGDPQIGRRELHHDVACQIHDLDHNGTNEVIVAGDRQLVVLDGRSGKPEVVFPIEQYASDCIVFADLSGQGWPGEILVKTRYGKIWAYAADGRLLWTVQEPGGYPTSHQPFPVDLDGDGRDEILAGYAALNSDGSIRWVLEVEKGHKNGGHADCWRVVRVAQRPEDTRLVMTMCGGEALVMTDGLGQLVWRVSGCHYESVDVGEIRDDIPGLELVVDIDHLPAPPMPLCLFSEKGREVGRINTDYTRHHALVDWNGDGLQEIGSAEPRGLFDGYGRRVCSFAVGEGERPMLFDAVDLTGCGMRDVMLTTVGQDTYKVYLYRNEIVGSARRDRPAGTGLNYTLY
ncbi:MAG: hypothetical protein GXY58_02950 [Planctomycetaceae bacterium]|nr:hypothetical protein [Planctomycetaceae bacterium]